MIIEDPEALAARDSGVVGHEIFDNLDELYLARKGGVVVIIKRTDEHK